MDCTPIDLSSSALLLHDGGRVTSGARRMSGDVDGWTVAVFHVETDEDVHGDQWEMHPAADEVVCVLAGGARFVLRPEPPADLEGGPGAGSAAAADVVTLTAGTAYIVPRGRWHRVELDEPSDLLSITLRRGTQLEPRG